MDFGINEQNFMPPPNDAVVLNPVNFNKIFDMLKYFKEKDVVVLDFKDTNKDTARRIVDFFNGVTIILGGQTIKATDNLMVFKIR